MSSILLQRIDATKLYPPFLAAVFEVLHEAREAGTDYWAISGYRTYGEQGMLYDLGRTKPGRIVTNADAGESAHNFGLAVDLCRDKSAQRAGLQPDYEPESYELLRMLAPKHGLLWGGTWKHPDRPHLQLPGYVTAVQLTPLRFAYEKAGLLSVFQFLDAGA